jgi:hypothetical protein
MGVQAVTASAWVCSRDWATDCMALQAATASAWVCRQLLHLHGCAGSCCICMGVQTATASASACRQPLHLHQRADSHCICICMGVQAGTEPLHLHGCAGSHCICMDMQTITASASAYRQRLSHCMGVQAAAEPLHGCAGSGWVTAWVCRDSQCRLAWLYTNGIGLSSLADNEGPHWHIIQFIKCADLKDVDFL